MGEHRSGGVDLWIDIGAAVPCSGPLLSNAERCSIAGDDSTLVSSDMHRRTRGDGDLQPDGSCGGADMLFHCGCPVGSQIERSQRPGQMNIIPCGTEYRDSRAWGRPGLQPLSDPIAMRLIHWNIGCVGRALAIGFLAGMSAGCCRSREAADVTSIIAHLNSLPAHSRSASLEYNIQFYKSQVVRADLRRWVAGREQPAWNIPLHRDEDLLAEEYKQYQIGLNDSVPFYPRDVVDIQRSENLLIADSVAHIGRFVVYRIVGRRWLWRRTTDALTVGIDYASGRAVWKTWETANGAMEFKFFDYDRKVPDQWPHLPRAGKAIHVRRIGEIKAILRDWIRSCPELLIAAPRLSASFSPD